MTVETGPNASTSCTALAPNGFYVPPGDAAALRRSIEYLLDHPAEREALGAAGRATVSELFTVDQFVARMCDLVRAATGRSPHEAAAARFGGVDA